MREMVLNREIQPPPEGGGLLSHPVKDKWAEMIKESINPNKTIFSVTGVSYDYPHGSRSATRCFGWYKDLGKAVSSVVDNIGDLHELRYKHIVIEEIEEGLWMNVVSEKWFEWDGGKFIPVDKPERFEGVSGFGMG